MTKITAAEVNKLRQQTGVGIMDCKNALTEADGNIEKAIELLRKKGQKLANKRADRDANEGRVTAKVDKENKLAAILMLNCETDFVAMNQDFIDFSNTIINIALENKAKSLDDLKTININGKSIEDSILDMIGKIGEKINISHYELIEDAFVYAYNHPGNRIASIVGFDKKVANIENLGKEITMQIAAMNPIAIDKDNISKEVVEKEIEIGKELAIQEGKPADLAEKIAVGKLNKFFKENTLLNQEYIGDNKKSVTQYISEYDKELKIVDFKRFALGQ